MSDLPSAELLNVFGGAILGIPDTDAVRAELYENPGMMQNAILQFTDDLYLLGRLAFAATITSEGDDVWNAKACERLRHLAQQWDILSPVVDDLLNELVRLEGEVERLRAKAGEEEPERVP